MFKKTLSLLLTAVIAFACIGCGSEKDADSPESAIAEYYQAVKAKDFKTMAKHMESSESEITQRYEQIEKGTAERGLEPFFNVLLENYHYTTDVTYEDEDSATIEITGTNVNASVIQEEFLEKLENMGKSGNIDISNYSDEEVLKLMEDTLMEVYEDNKEETLELKTSVSLKKTEEGWVACDVSGDLLRVIFGGLLGRPTVDLVTDQQIKEEQEELMKEAEYACSSIARSRKEVIQYLLDEGYDSDDAINAADHCNANWYEQAAKRAIEYADGKNCTAEEVVVYLLDCGFNMDEAKEGALAAGYYY